MTRCPVLPALAKEERHDAELVQALWPEMPSGVAVTPGGRIFLSFPRWLDRRAFTVAELVDGELVPFPDAISNYIDVRDAARRLFSVQSVVAQGDATLWVLDSGRPHYVPALPGAAKLLEIDLATRRIGRTYEIPLGAARLRTYLNDVRFDFRRGAAGTAYITDSGTLLSRCGLIVVDLATGRKIRRLDGHPSVQPRLDVVRRSTAGSCSTGRRFCPWASPTRTVPTASPSIPRVSSCITVRSVPASFTGWMPGRSPI